MVLTLALPDDVGDPAEVGRVLSGSVIGRLQVSAQSPDRPFQQGTIRPWVEMARDQGVPIVLSVSTLLNNSSEDRSACVVQGRPGLGSDPVLRRRCPIHSNMAPIAESIAQIADEASDVSEDWSLHLSYFRFENVHQCVAEDCIARFKNSTGHKEDRPDHKEDRPDIVGEAFLDWIEWRQVAMASALEELIIAASRHYQERVQTSIEIDFDELKRYLSGPEIEEGLSLSHLGPVVDEIYIHVESSQVSLDPGRRNVRESYATSYVDYLKYVVASSKRLHASPQLFFWNLADSTLLRFRIQEHLSLARTVESDGVVLYSPLVRQLVTEVDAMAR